MSRNFDALMLGSIEIFCLAAESGSFTAAAQSAGVTPASVSRTISRLEKRLGVLLFVRTTRRIQLTDAGRSYFERCRKALQVLVEAEREVSGQQKTLKGHVKISIATPMAHHLVLPLLARFRAMHPQVAIEANVENRNVDLVAEGFDLAIRARLQPDSGMIVRTLVDAPLVVVASAEYLRRRGEPATLDDLEAHDCIQFVMPSSGQRVPWQFRVDGRDIDIETRGGHLCTGDFLAPPILARAGAGLLQTYRFMVRHDLESGLLREVLVGHGGRSRPFSLLYPSARHVPSRVRALIEFLMKEVPRSF